MNYTLNIRGQLLSLDQPCIMGILNATPDSFYAGSRRQTEVDIARRACEIVEQGGAIIDVGAYSTRPGAAFVSEEEEMARLRLALATVRRELPDAIVSVDTFRPNVARWCIEDYGADIINDVGAPATTAAAAIPAAAAATPAAAAANPAATSAAATASGVAVAPAVSSAHPALLGRPSGVLLRVPYILMSQQPTLETVLTDLADKAQRLRAAGQKDIIVDPGFGFGKTLEQNYAIMNQLERFRVLGLPLLVGISRKSMIFRLLGSTPAEALNGTTALNTIALLKGASILRVHDVAEAAECVAIVSALSSASLPSEAGGGSETSSK